MENHSEMVVETGRGFSGWTKKGCPPDEGGVMTRSRKVGRKGFERKGFERKGRTRRRKRNGEGGEMKRGKGKGNA